MSGTPPGWYPDGQGSVRWWDGEAWTNHTHGPTPAVDRPVPIRGGSQSTGPGGRSSVTRTVLIAVVVLGFVASLVVGGIVLLGGEDDGPVAGPSSTEPGDLSTTSSSEATEATASSEPLSSPPTSASEPTSEPTSSSPTRKPPPEPIGDPEDTVVEYLTAIQDQDCEALLAVVGPPLRRIYDDCPSVLTPQQADFTYRIVSTRTDGDTAVVQVDSLFSPGRADGGDRVRFSAETTLEDDAWIVTLVRIR